MTKSLLYHTNTFLRNYCEYLLLLVCVGVAIVIYSMGYFSYLFLILSVLFGLIIYIILKNRYLKNKNEDSDLLLSNTSLITLRHVTSIIFFVSFGLSMFSLLYGFYSKNPWYYVFIAICAAVIASEILLVKTERQGLFNIFKSFLLVLNITLTNQIVFPEGIALPDFSLHLNHFVLPILETGFVSQITTGNYEYFPSHHILSAISILIGGSDPKMTYICLGGLLICLGILFLYLIGRKFVGLKFALFVGVIFTCLDYYIMYGSHPEHQAYNFAFSVILLALILFFYKSQDRRFIPLCVITMTMMVFAHHFSAMIILIIIGSLFIVELFQRLTDSHYEIRLWPIIQIYGLILLLQWIYYSSLFGSLVGIIKSYSSAFQNVSANIITATVYDQIPLSTLFVNSLGSCILLSLSVIGFVLYFKRHSLFDKFVMVTAVVLTLLLAIGIVFQQVALLPDRLYPYLQVFALVFLAAEGIKFLIVAIKPHVLKIGALVSIILLLSFFSCSSTIAGFETSPFVDEHLSYFKLYDTPQEINYRQWNIDHMPKKAPIISVFPLTDKGILDVSNIPAKSILTYNKLYLRTGFVHQYGGHMGQYSFIKMVPEESEKLTQYDMFYNNGVVIAYAT